MAAASCPERGGQPGEQRPDQESPPVPAEERARFHRHPLGQEEQQGPRPVQAGYPRDHHPQQELHERQRAHVHRHPRVRPSPAVHDVRRPRSPPARTPPHSGTSCTPCFSRRRRRASTPTPSKASRSSARSPARSAAAFLEGSGTLMKELGRLLVQAHGLCEKHGTSYSDYLDRVLGLPRTSAERHREGAHPGPGSARRLREHAQPRLDP